MGKMEKSPEWTRRAKLGTGPLSTEPYVSREFFETARDAIFRKTWLNVGRVEELAEPGSYVVKPVPVAKTSVLVIRGRDGVIRAFHNVCAHRGNELVWRNAGKCEKALTCKFHGWFFSPEGKLLGVPDRHTFFNLNSDDLGLAPITLQIWRGFIFINLAEKPAENLETFLAEMGQRLSPYPFEDFSLRSFYSADLRVNWMVAMDAFQEGYHAGFLHGIWTKTSDRVFLVDARVHDLHHSCSFSVPGRNEATRVEALASRYGQSGMYLNTATDRVPGVNPANHPNWFFDCNVIFPNFFVDVSQRSYFTYNFWPISENRTVFEVRTYDRPSKNYAQAVALSYSRVRLRTLLLEDLSTLERTQLGLESGAKSTVVVSDEEVLVRHSHEIVTRLVRAAREESAA